MRKSLLLIASVLALGAAASPASAIQCVPYAREVSGINLKGDAWQWWNAAAGQYDRGRAPKAGAVLVFNRQGSMSHGHVSVVTRVMTNRMILVDHANWAPARTSGRGAVTTSVPLIDVSPKNDWSQVRVWFQPAGDFGSRVYRTEGFVYRPHNQKFNAKGGMHLAAMGRAATIFTNTPTSQQKQPVEAVKPASVTTSSRIAAPAAVAPVAAKAVAPTPAEDSAAATHSQAPSAGMVSVAKQIYQNRTNGADKVKQTSIFN